MSGLHMEIMTNRYKLYTTPRTQPKKNPNVEISLWRFIYITLLYEVVWVHHMCMFKLKNRKCALKNYIIFSFNIPYKLCPFSYMYIFKYTNYISNDTNYNFFSNKSNDKTCNIGWESVYSVVRNKKKPNKYLPLPFHVLWDTRVIQKP